MREGGRSGGLVRSGFWTLVAQGAGLGLAFVAQAGLARILGGTEYGVFRYSWSWVAILSVVACLGFRTALQRFMPVYLSEGNRGLACGLARGARWLTLTVAGVAGIVLTAGLTTSGEWFETRLTAMGATAAAVAIVLLTLLNINTHLGRSYGAFVASFMTYYIGRPLGVLAVSGVLVLGAKRSGEVALAGVDGALLVLVWVQYVLLGRKERALWGRARPAFEWRRWLGVALPVLLISGFEMILGQTDVLMVGGILGPAAVGTYAVAALVANTVGMIHGSALIVLGPAVAERFHAGRRDELAALLRKASTLIFWPSLIYGAVLTRAAKWILGVFGHEYTTGGGPGILAILAVGYVAMAACGPVSVVLNVTGWHQASAVVYGLAAVANIGLNAALIPWLGSKGAAIATLLSMGGWNVALVVIALRKAGLNTTILPFRHAGR